MDLIKSNRNFRLLLTGSLVSSFGDYLYDIAITLLIYDISKSVDAIAYMWISKAALRILILYWGGIVTDRFNRKLIITIINYVSAPIALMFVLIDKNSLWIAYLGVFLLQSLNDVDNCSESAILPELVSKEDIPKANTIFSFTNHTLILISLALSGLIYKLVGAQILFIINAASFLLSALFFQFIKYKPSQTDAVKNIKLLDLSVLKVLKENRLILLIIVSSIPLAMVSRIYDVTNILIADKKLHITSAGIIYFRYAMAIGGFLAPVIIKLKPGNSSLNRYAASSIALLICVGGFALSGNLLPALFILAGFGFSASLQSIYFRSLIQENTSVDYLGRVFSFYRIVMTLVSLITVSLIPAANNMLGIERLTVITIIPSIIIFLFLYYKYQGRAKSESAGM